MKTAMTILCALVLAACGGSQTAPKAPGDAATPPSADGTSGGGGTGKAEAPTGDWSLQEKEYWAKMTEEMQGWIDTTNQACGTKISGAFAAESFKGKFTEGGSYGLSAYARSSCQAPFSAIGDLCGRGDMQKKAVQDKINKVVCEYGGSSYDLSGGTLSVKVDPDKADGKNASTVTTEVTDFLKTKL